MKTPRFLPLFFFLGLFLGIATVRGDEPPPTAKPRESLWIIPHTHWEGAVFKTREEYLDVGLPNIVKALHLLRTQPDFRFVLDQVAYVKPFLERYPELEADFRKFVKEGRLEIVLGLDIMPDVNIPGGETFVRQMQYGKGYYREKLGMDVTAAWLIDSFGHHAQMPQLLRKGGYTSFWFMRGVPRMDHPSEFLWEGLDGSKIAAFWMPQTYAVMFGSPRELPAFRNFVRDRFDKLGPNATGPERLGPTGVDVGDPEEQLAPMVAAYNAQPDAPIALRLAVPSEFEAVVSRRADRKIFKGELNPIFQGIYSSRIELKHRMRDMERRLLTAEKLSVIAGGLDGAPVDTKGLWRAWEPVLFNETHDLSSGVMTDHVYEDTIRGYDFARRLADDLIDKGLDTLAARIETRGRGVPVIVFNALGWSRSDAAEVTVGFDEAGVAGLAVLDPDGWEIPAQIIEALRYPEGGLKTARVAFVARDVPSLGHAVFRIVPRDEPTPGAAKPSEADELESPLYRVAIDRATGAITSLKLKADGWEVLAGQGNVVARQQDKGDLWELYRGLDGGSRIAMTTRQAVPKSGDAKLSNAFRDKPGSVILGPVFSEFHVAHPFDNGSFTTTIRLYNELRRIEFTTTLVNNEKYVRYQALFPTTIKEGRGVQEIPFGAIERPTGIEFPAQNWVDYGDGNHGLTLLNIGAPGNVVSDGTLMLSLLRSHNLGAYGFGGGYEPGMSSESGFQIGTPRTVRYALVPHSGGWREASIVRDGLEFNNPLLVRKAAPHDGRISPCGSALDVSDPNVIVSALQPGRDGTAVVRVYESSGQPATGVTLTTHAGFTSAREVNLMEDAGRELAVDQGVLRFDLTPFEIKTFQLIKDSAPR